MDLATGARKIIVATEHNTRDGRPKIVDRCTLPLTVVGRVSTIVSELAVMDVTPQGLVARYVAPDISWESLCDRTATKLVRSNV
jgi:3-oxoacid CoA-transferase B subunit